MSETDINRLCRTCVNRCRQSESARIVECPNYLKKPTDREFRRMVDDLDGAEVAARNLRKRARDLIAEALDAVTDAGDDIDEETGEPITGS